VLALVLVGAVALSGCGGSDGVSTENCTKVAPKADGTTAVTIEAKNMQFTQRCVQVEPGEVTFTFQNLDKGIGHNLRVKGSGVNEATDIETGRVTQTLKVDLDTPGTYNFTCDPHANMTGKIVVEAPTTQGMPTPTTAG
jgi:plastocyanin